MSGTDSGLTKLTDFWLKRLEAARKKGWAGKAFAIGAFFCALAGAWSTFLKSQENPPAWAALAMNRLFLAGLLSIAFGGVLTLFRPSRRRHHKPGGRPAPPPRKHVVVAFRATIFIIAAAVLILSFKFFSNYTRFKAWGLPWDLTWKLPQLQELRIGTRITDISWLRESRLKALILTRAELPDLRSLPKRLGGLGHRNGVIRYRTGIPNSITQLDLRGTVAEEGMSNWPTSLQELKLPGRIMDHLAGSSLGAIVTHMVLEDCAETPLRELPRSITSLELDCRVLRSLEGIPPDLDSLVLRNTLLTSLEGVPESVTQLVLDNNINLTDLSGLPPHLTRLYVERTPLPLSAEFIRASSLAELAVDWPLDATALPASLTALSVPDFTAPGVHLPGGLRSLAISKQALPDIEDWGQLECLDLGFEDAPVTFRDMPRRLKVLRTSIQEGRVLDRLPENLVTLDLKEWGQMPIGVRPLQWIPPTVTRLRIDWLHAERITDLRPKLEELRLNEPRGLVELPDLRDMPLKVLSVRNADNLAKLPALPADLRELDIAGTKINRLTGLPRKLQALGLAPNQVTGLWGLSGLPESVHSLSFEGSEGGGVMDFSWDISVCDERRRR